MRTLHSIEHHSLSHFIPTLPGIFHISLCHVICEDLSKLLCLFGGHQSAWNHGHQILWQQGVLPPGEGAESVLPQILGTLHSLHVLQQRWLEWRILQMKGSLRRLKELISIRSPKAIESPTHQFCHSLSGCWMGEVILNWLSVQHSIWRAFAKQQA